MPLPKRIKIPEIKMPEREIPDFIKPRKCEKPAPRTRPASVRKKRGSGRIGTFSEGVFRKSAPAKHRANIRRYSPASGWIIKPLNNFKEIDLSKILSPEEIQEIKNIMGSNSELKWFEIERKLKPSGIKTFGLNQLIQKLRGVSAQLRLSKFKGLNIECRNGVLIANKRMPLSYKILRYLLENPDKIEGLNAKNPVQLSKILAKALNAKEDVTNNALEDLRCTFREFGDNFLINIAEEYKNFCTTKQLPKKRLGLNNIIGEDLIRKKILTILARLGEKTLAKLDKLTIEKIGAILAGRKNENMDSIRKEISRLMAETGARNMAELAGAAKDFERGKMVERPPVSYTDIVGDEPIWSKIVAYLTQLDSKERVKLNRLTLDQLASKLAQSLNKDVGSIRAQIVVLKRETGARNISELPMSAGLMENSVRVKILNYLAELNNDTLDKLNKLSDNKIASMIAQPSGENANCIGWEIGRLKRELGARNMTELAAAAKDFKKGEMVERPPVSYAEIVGTSIRVKVLNQLAELNINYLKTLNGLSDAKLGALFANLLGEKAETIRKYLGQIKKIFREKDLIKLVKKWHDLQKKHKIFGYNFFPKREIA